MLYKCICHNSPCDFWVEILFYFVAFGFFFFFLEGGKEGNFFHSSYLFCENDLVLQNYNGGLLKIIAKISRYPEVISKKK